MIHLCFANRFRWIPEFFWDKEGKYIWCGDVKWLWFQLTIASNAISKMYAYAIKNLDHQQYFNDNPQDIRWLTK